MFVRVSLFLCLIAGLVLFACKPQQASENKTEASGDAIEIPADFVEFHNKFHADTIFQLQNVVFPLENLHSDEIDGNWTADNWVSHLAFQNDDGMFQRDFQVLGKVVIEKINDFNGYFLMERRFANTSEGWKLIYYNITAPAFDSQAEEAQ